MSDAGASCSGFVPLHNLSSIHFPSGWQTFLVERLLMMGVL